MNISAVELFVLWIAVVLAVAALRMIIRGTGWFGRRGLGIVLLVVLAVVAFSIEPQLGQDIKDAGSFFWKHSPLHKNPSFEEIGLFAFYAAAVVVGWVPLGKWAAKH